MHSSRSLSTNAKSMPRWIHDRVTALRASIQSKLQWKAYTEQKFLVTCGSTASLVFGVSYLLLSSNERSNIDLDQALWKAFPKLTEDGKQILIPPQQQNKKGWKTLVLDMDEMLVGNTTGMQPKDTTRFIPFADGSFSHIHRPNLKAFLEFASANFEVILWTAGTKGYARECIQNMLHTHSLQPNTFDYVIARDKSWFEITPTTWYSKDLRQLDRPLENVLMFENAPVVKPSTNAIIVADYHYPIVTDTYAPCREGKSRSRMDLARTLRASMGFGSVRIQARPENSAQNIANATNAVTPCASARSCDDATLFTALDVIKRWKASDKPVHEFLQNEMKDGVLLRAGIQPHRTNVAEPMATLPLHRKSVST